ncbi:MAG: DUF4382 domain-containing protein [Ignavibacteria bacterium]|nr:DUF4382 domain-containing protein [Ignavibacteria bacterium]
MKTIQLLLLALGLFLLGCSDSDEPTAPTASQGEIKMSLVDSPAGFDAVNIVVTEVSVHQVNADSLSGWTVIDNTTRTFDLLKLTNGASGLLGTKKLDVGKYTQIRLKIGAGSNVVVAGSSIPLEVPSGSQSGLKLNHNFDIVANTLYELTLDFDASRSLRVTGNQYRLSPVIRVVANVTSGTVSGTASPVLARAIVSTVAGTDTLSAAADTVSGAFKLMAVPAGTYSIKVTPTAATFRDTTITGVQVVAQQDKSLGIITLRPR